MGTTPKTPDVAIWIETSRAYGRGLIRGIAAYLQQHGPWSIYFTPHGLHEPLASWLRRWKGDGILARIDDRRMAQALLARKLPLIDLRGRLPDLGIPPFGLDTRLVSQLAFDHLQERGLRQFGFFGMPRGEYVFMDQRRDFFCEAVTRAGAPCHVFDEAARPGRRPDWERDQKRLGQWLISLPRPIGIMCCNDDHGQQLLNACRGVGVGVPDDVAVIGVDNDEELCRLSTPALSSVAVNPDRVGFGAAAMLDRMMADGMLHPPHEVLYPPSHVVTRLSTDTLAVDDPALALALRFIRDHACDGISVDDVVQSVAVSRRYLERQMQTFLGRSPNQEILRVRIHRARLLLLETDLPLQTIARKAGFPGAKYMGEVFVREINQTPGALRRQSREPSGFPTERPPSG